jgi:hypothetical protein
MVTTRTDWRELIAQVPREPLLLCRRVGARGRVVSVEVDPLIAEGARAALAAAGYSR